MPDPLLKWPGGKRRLLRHIQPLLPAEFGTYYEPFAGSAALFFRIGPAEGVLSDTNSELINCYTQVRDNPDAVNNALSMLPSTEHDYYRIRALHPEDDVERAARFIYLTTLSFNGIYRTNQEGHFNVPFGFRPHLHPKPAGVIQQTSAALAGTELRCMDFEAALEDAAAGDLVYLDPPYTVAHGHNGFLRYNARIFSWADQHRLAALARTLSDRGCHVIVSNADHQSICDIYAGFRMVRIERQSSIAASQVHRRRITECVFLSY
ncbi:MAG TPA: Dam family site-specific DNA-(adenine-N6)-methyltransferase [Longimicrobium sp.]